MIAQTSDLIEGINMNEIIPKATTFCQQLYMWCKNNRLNLNESKTKCVMFRPQGSVEVASGHITLGPYQITIEKSVKLLGVIFMEHMSWNEHIKILLTKLSKAAGVLSRCRHILPANVKRTLYYALLNSHLYYCASVWGNTTLTNLHKLTLIQKKALRTIENATFLEHTDPLFRKYRIIKSDKIYTHKLLIMYKSAQLGKLDKFLDLASLKETVALYPFRYKPPYEIPFSRTHYGTERVKHTMPIALNAYYARDIDIQ